MLYIFDQTLANGGPNSFYDITKVSNTRHLDHYLSILKVLNSILRRIPTIDLQWVLTRVIGEAASF